MASMQMSSEPGRVVLRSRSGVMAAWYNGAPLCTEAPTSPLAWSRDGTLLAFGTAREGVLVFRLAKIKEDESGTASIDRVGQPIPVSHCIALAFAEARGGNDAHLTTYDKSTGDVAVWFIDGSGLSVPICVYSFKCAKFERESFPFVQFWGPNWACVRHGSEIRVYAVSGSSWDDNGYAIKLVVPGCTRTWVADYPTGSQRQKYGNIIKLATLEQGKRSAPSKVTIHAWNAPREPSSAEQLEDARKAGFQTIGGKSFFGSDTVDVLFSPTGDAALVKASCDHDETGGSYYGTSALYLVPTDGASPTWSVSGGGNSSNDLTKETVHDAAWNPDPSSREFIVIQGRKATIYSSKTATPSAELGSSGWNTIRWNPQGRFFMLGGFGNLPGNMVFFDRKHSIIGRAQDHGAKSFEWTADGLYFVTSRLHPWRRVDNGYNIWTYAGESVGKHAMAELYEASLQPALLSDFPDIPASTVIAAMAASSLSEKGTSAAKTSAYRPPKARGLPESGGVSAMLRKMRGETDCGPKISTSSAGPSVASENTDKNARRRAKRREKKQQESSQTTDSPTEEKAMDKDTAAKRCKILSKKLRQIEQLEASRTAGCDLNAEQLEKIASKKKLAAEIRKLEAMM